MSYMPQKTVDVQPGEYAAHVREIDYQKPGMHVKADFWVSPKRVYRGGAGRQSIEFERNGETKELHNHPGAGSFTLYKRVS